jgi:hypothetical protein
MNGLKVISGGQTGADLAGLWAAKIYGIETGGKAPKGWITQYGQKPRLLELFCLKESTNEYHGLTLENCESSDLTLIFASNIRSPGTRLTLHRCVTNAIHYRVFCYNSSDYHITEHSTAILDLIKCLEKKQLGSPGNVVINVSGNSTSSSADAFSKTFLTMCSVFESLGFTSQILNKSDKKNVESLLKDCYDDTIYETLCKTVEFST